MCDECLGFKKYHKRQTGKKLKCQCCGDTFSNLKKGRDNHLMCFDCWKLEGCPGCHSEVTGGGTCFSCRNL